jgi:hypothetical protein
VTITARFDGLTATTTLRVVPDVADHVGISLIGGRTRRAGETVALAARVEDRYYNATGDGPVAVSIDATAGGGGSAAAASCSVDPLSCSATDAGAYVITAAWRDFSASAPLSVVPGPPAVLRAFATPSRVRPHAFANHSSTVTVTVTDAYGNAVAGERVSWLLTRNSSGRALIPPVFNASPPTGASQPTDASGHMRFRYEAGDLPGTDEYTIDVRALTTVVRIKVSLLP